MNIETAFPEIKASMDPKEIPWHDAVVWSDHTEGGKHVYEWLSKTEIRSVSWTAGLLSININDQSALYRDLMFILIQAPFVTIGRNVPV